MLPSPQPRRPPLCSCECDEKAIKAAVAGTSPGLQHCKYLSSQKL